MDGRSTPVAALSSRRTRLAIRLRTHPIRWIAVIALLAQVPWAVGHLADKSGNFFFVALLGMLVLTGAASVYFTHARAGLLDRAGALVVVTMLPLCILLIVLLIDPDWDAVRVLSGADELSLYGVMPVAVSFVMGLLLRNRPRERRSVALDVLLSCAAVAVLFTPLLINRKNDGLAWWVFGWAVLGSGAFHRLVTGTCRARWAAPVLAAVLGLFLSSRVGGLAEGARDGWCVVIVATVPLYLVARLASSLSVPPPDHPLRADHALEIGAVGTRGSCGTSGSESMSARKAGPE